MATLEDVQKQSVTEGDAITATDASAVSVFLGPTAWSSYFSSGLLEGVKGATGLPMYGSKNADFILSETPLLENMWSSAVNAAISKQVALGFTIKDGTDSALRTKQAQQLMLTFDGLYETGLARHLRDYLTTDNGAFIEIVRQSSAAGSKVIGLRHLDSMRCFRTGDPERPVVYMDRQSGYHLMRADDVISMSDMTSPKLEMRGYGISAARRAFETILKMVAIETYVREKVSGSRNLAIHIVNGITADQLGGALASSGEANKGKGFVVYKGSTIIPMLKSEPPSVVTIPLAEIPDGFSAAEERKDAYLRYANALGVPVQDIQPLSGQGLGTGTQSTVLAESADGRGLAAWRKAFEHEITHRVFPTATTFSFARADTKDKQEKAQALASMSTALQTLVGSAILTPEQALNVLVDDGYMPREFLQTDGTAGGVVEDNDSILSGAQVAEAQQNQQAAAAEIPTINGQTLDVEPNVEMRKTLRRLVESAESLKALKPQYLNSETWVNKPPTIPPMSDDEFDALLLENLPSAERLARRVLND
jgi:hypothetical protein